MRIPINAQHVYGLNSARPANTLGADRNLQMR